MWRRTIHQYTVTLRLLGYSYTRARHRNLRCRDVCALRVFHVVLSRVPKAEGKLAARHSPTCGPVPKAERVSRSSSQQLTKQSVQLPSMGSLSSQRRGSLVVVIESLASRGSRDAAADTSNSHAAAAECSTRTARNIDAASPSSRSCQFDIVVTTLVSRSTSSSIFDSLVCGRTLRRYVCCCRTAVFAGAGTRGYSSYRGS